MRRYTRYFDKNKSKLWFKGIIFILILQIFIGRRKIYFLLFYFLGTQK